MARRPVNLRTAPMAFDQKLVLNRWAIRLLGFTEFERLADLLKAQELEGFTAEGFSHFLAVLLAQPNSRLSADTLREYDTNIACHWHDIMAQRVARGDHLTPKYFQYLALLFTELYLDRYFSDVDQLCAELNEYVQDYNLDKDGDDNRVQSYSSSDLRKIAFWQATGSGKTYIMHVNIRQYQHYLSRAGRAHELNRIILITPNESLSRQHLKEFELSGINADLFNKDQRSLFEVDILDINKLSETSKVKTVAVEAFEGNNLVLVDEGHRGVGGDVWKDYRDRLSASGFAMEYSATFGQAVSAANAATRRSLTQEYARAILFDYSYRYFYKDGYGKEFKIYNLALAWDAEPRLLYLTGALLAFYQQVHLYRVQGDAVAPFQIQAPLWVFVGGSVTGRRQQTEISDVTEILRFFARVTHPDHAAATVRRIGQLLDGTSGLAVDGREIFLNAYEPLKATGLSAEGHYRALLQLVFNSDRPRVLHAIHLKQNGGEIALAIGAPETIAKSSFGVVNIGDASGLMQQLRGQNDLLQTQEQDYGSSLFDSLDQTPHMTLLIGAKKFTEGWNSWRVSTMGLMNVGRGEGAQIIQLFGRGVRLQGYGFGLKRSNFVAREQSVRVPPNLTLLETLQVFGVRADYMTQFRQYMEDEGVHETSTTIFTIPTIRRTYPKTLKMLVIKDGVDYRAKGGIAEIRYESRVRPITLDWYPKLKMLASDGRGTEIVTAKETTQLGQEELTFIDWTKLTFALLAEKQEKGYHRLVITSQAVKALFQSQAWYTLFLPSDRHGVTHFDQSHQWQEIATALGKKYLEALYKTKRAEFEAPHLTYRELAEDNPNWVDQYEVFVEQSETTLVTTLADLKTKIETGVLAQFPNLNRSVAGLTVADFEYHLYTPLLYLARQGSGGSKVITISPVPLVESEWHFVNDLRRLVDQESAWFADKGLYLLRNKSKAGLGFFEAGNFYPDFILWLVVNNHQYISFVDPKGLRQIQEGVDNEKLRFHETIKMIETRIQTESGAQDVTLNSFIVTRTKFDEVSGWRDHTGATLTKEAFARYHVYFQQDDARDFKYLRQIFNHLLPETPL